MDHNEDAFLIENGVRFLPWIGSSYKSGFRGCRLLVLGESHYGDWDGKEHEMQNFTRERVEEVIDRDKDCKSLWRYIEQAILNERRVNGWAPSGGRALWEYLVFYNFVQSPIQGGARVRPTRAQFIASQPHFRAIMEALRPERVLVCGKGLWGWMEDCDAGHHLHADVQAYRLADGSAVWCLATVHPSSGRYSWSRIHSIISAFLNNPKDAANFIANI